MRWVELGGRLKVCRRRGRGTNDILFLSHQCVVKAMHFSVQARDYCSALISFISSVKCLLLNSAFLSVVILIVITSFGSCKIIFRRMYWCDWGDDHKIEVANMDGRNRSILFQRGLYWPNGLTLDDANRRLYWVDAWFETIGYYDLGSHTITTLMKNSSILPHPFGLTLFENYLYWTDWTLDVVYQAEKDTLSDLKVVLGGLSQPMDIHAYDTNKTLPG